MPNREQKWNELCVILYGKIAMIAEQNCELLEILTLVSGITCFKLFTAYLKVMLES